MITNAAVFINNQRKFKGVDVEYTDTEIIVKNRVNGSEIRRYSVVEVGKVGMAWDVVDDSSQEPGSLLRLVAQQGCGCSGMKPYQNDPEYSGPFKRR